MATGVNYWSSNELSNKVRQSVWGGEQESSSEEGGGEVTWEIPAMEVKGQLISVPDPITCPDRKQRERMAELQERRRGLQVLLSTRLAELRRICLQEAELTGAVPSDFPLELGERPPRIRRRGGNRKCQAEEEDSQRSKTKKTIFSGALRKHSDPEHNTQTHTHHGKRTVHRGCHTDDSVRSESSSTSDSTGLENDDGGSQSHPLVVSAGSPEVFYQNRTRRNSLLNRTDHPKTHKPLLLNPPPPHSQDSSSGPSDVGLGPGPAEGGARVNVARHSNSSDCLLDRIPAPEEEGGRQQERLWMNGSRQTNTGGGAVRCSGGRGGGYSEVLQGYVWGTQRQHSQPSSRQPITAHHKVLYNGYSSQHPPGAPPTYCGHQGDQHRVKVTRTKSCGPFLPLQQVQTDNHDPPLPAIQPDPHPNLMPPRPPQLPPAQDAQLEGATRSLHKALALEGLRDWYLRNTIGSTHHNQAHGKVGAQLKGEIKGQAGGEGALQGRRTHGIIRPPTYRMETSHQQQKTLPHSATFHGHPLHGRSMDGSLYDSFPPQKQEDQPSPGTLV